MELNYKWIKKIETVDKIYLKNAIKQIKLLRKSGRMNIQICDIFNIKDVKTKDIKQTSVTVE